MAKLGKFYFPVSGRKNAPQNSSVAEADNHIPKALRVLGVEAINLDIESKRNGWSYRNFDSSIPKSRSSSSVPSLNDSQEISCHENLSKVRGKASSVLGIHHQQNDEEASISNSVRSSCENSSLASKSSHRFQKFSRNTSHSTSDLSGFDFDLKPKNSQMVFTSHLTHKVKYDEQKEIDNLFDSSLRNIKSSSTPILCQNHLDIRNNYCYPDKDEDWNHKSSSLAIDAEKRIEAARKIEGAFSGYGRQNLGSSMKGSRLYGSNDSAAKSYASPKKYVKDELSTLLDFDSNSGANFPEDWVTTSILALATDSEHDESDKSRISTSSEKSSQSERKNVLNSQIEETPKEAPSPKVPELSETQIMESVNGSCRDLMNARRHCSVASLKICRVSTHSNRFMAVTGEDAAPLQDLRPQEFLEENHSSDSQGSEEFSPSHPSSPRYIRQSLLSNFSHDDDVDDDDDYSKFYSPHNSHDSSPEDLSTCSSNIISRFAMQSNESKNSDPRLSTLSSSSVLVEFARIGRVVRCGRPQSKIRTCNTQRRNGT
ncbi:BgTH12-06971 [Blumeria graminis f. sp. triticale]|uniref:BgtAc-30174 n=3 Tax=Blumeria graminis TaxID=34373 RepID=A0A9X9MNX5_BLUGR|nr:hypothetical protein BGT96224_Ac30174 [Blumeria graminis f. sp. tritici 96224]CAD6506039.1 BgTH12-06971 [Blumeria graminis f. sp. triticale]VDB94688.1 BgtAc-30174 [Blumeria graminis f. sp. tritici]